MFQPTTVEELVASLKRKGINNVAVLEAIRKTPRHFFIASSLTSQAYSDTALPIAHKQTISQPFVVARMTELLLEGGPLNKVLEVGTGSGYQAAVLAQLVDEVYTIERIKSLYEEATQRLQQLGLSNVFTKLGDGAKGWAEVAPFDGIIVTAASPAIPQYLLDQLVDGGRLIVPIGQPGYQQLQLITRRGNDFTIQIFDPVVFVPLLSGIEK
jgi:protein-L-isoaspartate(D-aspartate) O-methyltransferase